MRTLRKYKSRAGLLYILCENRQRYADPARSTPNVAATRYVGNGIKWGERAWKIEDIAEADDFLKAIGTKNLLQPTKATTELD